MIDIEYLINSLNKATVLEVKCDKNSAGATDATAANPAIPKAASTYFSFDGALGVVFISKNPKIAAAPLIVMVALFTLIPGLSSSVSVLVPVGALIAIGVARVLYKKGMLDKKPAGKAG